MKKSESKRKSILLREVPIDIRQWLEEVRQDRERDCNCRKAIDSIVIAQLRKLMVIQTSV